ncbi:hypothetical protein C5E02_01275 [Rathayibacter rathayi]|uniref:hypothetical protein n=1 Tax=Rathayibacter rathayi TaxID=33887 RepID=UPI000BCF8642|nr:hypothetical protein [Rathayibacter rathayi]AZZ48009.1 hypothetical protein C1O28_01365 [Rathayibacter rathayi]MWV74717.1 hypothetical protein [Rathayibacter rathayi NCPPB 2980 = VKM Ac-1601]PPF50552.1 hypothetical protein C5C08_04845 [Rathayibacter rathayi]PPG13665.1 hypothetical protein C5C11_06740 [Rathayibacter rathayi]PPG45295.1 hypothetical protein C5C20_04490 [Rathayibacter rathayi]
MTPLPPSDVRADRSEVRADARRALLDDGAEVDSLRSAVAWLDARAPVVARIIRAALIDARRQAAEARSEARELRELVQRFDSATFH